MTADVEKQLEKAAALIKARGKVVAFTGAGISVESGIPPFRGKGGLWESCDPSILDIDRFRSEPGESWKAIKALFYDHWVACGPNRAHLVLADWEARGIVLSVITQNIDDLHGRALSRAVAEYHGSLRELVCMRCGSRRQAAEVSLEELPPRCPACGGVFKPDFVFFGEAIPEAAARAARAAVQGCAVLLIIGTSGEVQPAASLPPAEKRTGVSIIEINPAPSAYTDRISDVFIPLGACEAMDALDALLKA